MDPRSRTLPSSFPMRLWLCCGERLVDWIYVSDVVDGFMALAQAPGLDGATIDLGSGTLVSIREIVQQLASDVDRRARAEVGALPDRPRRPTRIAKTAETFARMGWKPQVSLGEGLERTVDWYRREWERSPEMQKGIQV